jgi:high-affinity nickel permease
MTEFEVTATSLSAGKASYVNVTLRNNATERKLLLRFYQGGTEETRQKWEVLFAQFLTGLGFERITDTDQLHGARVMVLNAVFKGKRSATISGLDSIREALLIQEDE